MQKPKHEQQDIGLIEALSKGDLPKTLLGSKGSSKQGVPISPMNKHVGPVPCRSPIDVMHRC